MALADGDFRLIREEVLDGPMAMAYDEVAAETVAAGGPATVRVYQWLPSTLSLGYNQDPGTVDWEHCEETGVTVTRRPTGGGAIYHDVHGDVSYSVVAPAEDLPGDLMDSYEVLCQPVLDAFREVGVDVDYVAEERESLYEPACYLRGMHPAHDVVAPDGRKISGNAQYRTRDAVVQHGSLSFSVDAEGHLACFDDPGVSPEGFRERVAGVDEFDTEYSDQRHDSADVGPMDSFDYQRARLVRVLEDTLAEFVDCEEGDWTDGEEERAREIAEEKYGNDRWVRDGEDPLGT